MTKLPTIEEVLSSFSQHHETECSYYYNICQICGRKTDMFNSVIYPCTSHSSESIWKHDKCDCGVDKTKAKARQQLSAIIRDIIGEDWPIIRNIDGRKVDTRPVEAVNGEKAEQRQKAKQYGVDLEEKE